MTQIKGAAERLACRARGLAGAQVDRVELGFAQSFNTGVLNINTNAEDSVP
ncbi:hypothetical protein [Phreatobacter oligotrophus]|uniref:hypothetical protein n=1 Tax=Phreatobacter oligotrophus TaxID=1122261 RepID=UPI0014751266|nr:hypothetical protein [Phreatobacter oligotrophus]